MRKKAVLVIVIVVVVGFLNSPIKAKAYTVENLFFDTDKDIYYNDETIQINASWELDYDPPYYVYTSIIIFNGTYEKIWESPRYDIADNYSESWLVDIKSLSLSYKNNSNILYVRFHLYKSGGAGSSSWLETIEISIVKRNVSCELIGFENYLKYNGDLSFRAKFYNTTLGSEYYVSNYQISFEILLQNFTAIFSNSYFTNDTGEFIIFISNIRNLSKGINYLQFTIINNQFFQSEVFQFEIYFEVRPVTILDSEKDEKEKKDDSEINQVVVISVSLTASTLFGIILFLYHRNMKKKPRNLHEITFKY